MPPQLDSAPVALMKTVKRRWYWLIPGIVASFLIPAFTSEKVQEPTPVVEAAQCIGTPEQIQICQMVNRTLMMMQMFNEVSQINARAANRIFAGENLKCLDSRPNQFVLFMKCWFD